MNAQKWRCRRCKTLVDMTAKRCACSTSPSPWEPIPHQASACRPYQLLLIAAALATTAVWGLWCMYSDDALKLGEMLFGK